MPGISFSHPWSLLLFLPLAAGTVWLARESLAGLPPERARFCLGLRLALVALLVAALAGPAVSFPARTLEVLFLLDRSASIPAPLKERQLEFLREATRRLPAEARAGILVFGRDAALESMPGRGRAPRQLHTQIAPEGTDIAAALRLGQAVLPEAAQRRLVLLSDGNQTAGDALEEAVAAASARVEVDVVPIHYQRSREVLLDRLAAPPRAKRGEPVEVRIVARSTLATRATLRLLRDGVLVAEQAWDLRPGVNALSMSQTLLQPGFHTWEAVLETGEDSLPDNNRALGFTHVRGEPRVLLVEGRPGDGALLERALRARSLRVERRGPGGLPATLAELQNYDTLLLVNLRADQATPEAMRLIRSAVRDLGLGLLMVGGEDSLTAGGWHGTPVEEALPVRMEVKRRREEPALALVLVIDHSGSMLAPIGGAGKLDYAKRAAQAAVGALRPEDEIGVLAFDSRPDWVAPLGRLGSGERVRAAIDSIGAGGGTELYPALVAAYEALARSRASVRHVVVLTDGQSAPGDFDGIARRLARAGVTLSSVGVGADADGPTPPGRDRMGRELSSVGVGADADGRLLARLAALGGGRYYPAARPEALPFIFDRETRLASRAALVEEPFRPRLTGDGSLLAGSAAPPLLFGYVATTPKPAPGVEVPMLSHRDEPIVAAWRYGLGRAAIVATDAKARWAAPWVADSAGYFSAFWPRVVRATLRASGESGLQATVAVESGEARVRVEALGPDGALRNGLLIAGRVAGPEGGHALRLEQTGPGRYEARFPAAAPGQYLVSLREEPDGPGASAGGWTVAGVAVPYPPEYRSLQPNMPLLLALAERTGGRVWPALEAEGGPVVAPVGLFRPARPARTAPLPLWAPLVLAAALLLPLDVGARRIGLSLRELAAALAPTMEALRRRFARTPRERRREEALERLRAARERAGTRTAPAADFRPPAAVAPPPAADGASLAAATPPPPDTRSPAAEARPAASGVGPPAAPDSAAESSTRRLLAAKRRAAASGGSGIPPPEEGAGA